MLAYLDSLCDALAARDAARLRNLIDGHPLVRLLPADAVAEVRRFLAGTVNTHTVPLAVLRFRDLTARLLNEQPRELPTPSVAAPMPSAPRRRRPAVEQTELPLSA